jgi:Transposase, Mutator family
VKQQAGKTTPPDSRSKRIRASRRGGHLLTRARSPSSNNGLPDHVCFRMPRSRTVASYSPPRTPLAARNGLSERTAPAAFHTVTNPIERFNREIGRRTDVVGIFPDDRSLMRLASVLAIEQNDEWLVGRSYINRGSMTTLYETRSALAPKTEEEKEVSELIAA